MHLGLVSGLKNSQWPLFMRPILVLFLMARVALHCEFLVSAFWNFYIEKAFEPRVNAVNASRKSTIARRSPQYNEKIRLREPESDPLEAPPLSVTDFCICSGSNRVHRQDDVDRPYLKNRRTEQRTSAT